MMPEVLLCAASMSEGPVKEWLEANYVGESYEPRRVKNAYGYGCFWLLEGRETPADIIKSLSDRGIFAEAREVDKLKCVYVPPQTVARGRRARWN